MLMKKLSEEHYIICDDSEIKQGDWYYLPRTNSVYQCKEDPTELNLERRWGVAKITHSTQPLEDYARADGKTIKVYVQVKPFHLYEVKELIGVVDVLSSRKFEYLKKVNENIKHKSQDEKIWIFGASDLGFTAGYNQALEDNKDKKYTEEDLRKAISETRRGMLFLDKYVNEFIQSLQPKTEWKVEFVDGKLKLKS